MSRVRCGVEIIAFEEPDLLAEVPGCVDPVAGMLMSGHWLHPSSNFEDVLIGCDRLPKFREARAMDLQREVRFHFLDRSLPIAAAGGEKMNPVQWLTRWNADAAFRRAVCGQDKWRTWRDGLALKLKGAMRCVKAVEQTRMAYATITGKPDDEKTEQMDEFMSEGGF